MGLLLSSREYLQIVVNAFRAEPQLLPEHELRLRLAAYIFADQGPLRDAAGNYVMGDLVLGPRTRPLAEQLWREHSSYQHRISDSIGEFARQRGMPHSASAPALRRTMELMERYRRHDVSRWAALDAVARALGFDSCLDLDPLGRNFEETARRLASPMSYNDPSRL